MAPSDLPKEWARLGDTTGNPAATLQLVLAIGQTRNPADTVRALSLLEPLIRSTDPRVAPWQPIARLLFARFAEQRRVEELLEKQGQQWRDAQRRIDALNEKLEALKAIERTLTTRPAPPPPAASAAGSAPANAPPAPAAPAGRVAP